MAKVPLISNRSITVTSNQFITASNYYDNSGTSSNAQRVTVTPGKYYDFGVNITANNITSSNRAMGIRKNGLLCGPQICLTACATGFFEGTICGGYCAAACDIINIRGALVCTGSYSLSGISFTFAATCNTLTSFMSRIVDSSVNNLYLPLNGGRSCGVTTEACAQVCVPLAGTFKNFHVQVASSAKTATFPVNFRKNAATPTCMTICITCGATGYYTASGSVAVCVGDCVDYNFNFTCSGGTGAITAHAMVDFETTTCKTFWTNLKASTAVASTDLFAEFGDVSYNSCETITQSEIINLCATISQTRWRVTANSLSGGGPTLVRPDADQSLGCWTNQAGSATNVFQSIDEVSACDTDYARSPQNACANIYQVTLGNLCDPGVSCGHIVRYRYSKDTATCTINLIVRLKQGTTTIASNTHNGISTTWTAGTFTLTSGEADSITNYNDLRLEFEVTAA